MRSLIKSCLRWVFFVFALPFLVSYFLEKLLFGKDEALKSSSQVLSLIPGQIGNYLRLAFYKAVITDCGDDTVISFATLLSQQDISIGKGVYIGPQCNLGRCEIGDYSLFGSGVHVMSGKGQHNFKDLDTPLKEQGGSFKKIRIGEDCWLGNGALVMANIGKKCVIGAGSVVISDIPDYAIAAGNPAKVIKLRK